MDVVAIYTSTNLIARFMNEWKPVNVLQFGAKNWYLYRSTPDVTRSDSERIQRAIDYTKELLYVKSGSNYLTNNVNSIVVPGGYKMPYSEINKNAEGYKDNFFTETYYPSTSACKHHVNNQTTDSVKIIANMCVPLDITSESGNNGRSYILRALLIEKNG